MKATEIIFDKNLEMYVSLKDLGNDEYTFDHLSDK